MRNAFFLISTAALAGLALLDLLGGEYRTGAVACCYVTANVFIFA